MTMTSRRPYMVRAIYDWILNNDCTPHIVVDALLRDVVVPERFVQDGRIVLNIAPGAVRGLDIGDKFLSFNARFGGVSMDVFVPFQAMIGIYAKENGEGMLFEAEELPPESPAPIDPPPTKPVKIGRPSLRVVK